MECMHMMMTEADEGEEDVGFVDNVIEFSTIMTQVSIYSNFGLKCFRKVTNIPT